MTKEGTASQGKSTAAELEITELQIEWMQRLLDAARGGGAVSQPIQELSDAERQQADAIFNYRMLAASMSRDDGPFRGTPSPFVKVERDGARLVFAGTFDDRHDPFRAVVTLSGGTVLDLPIAKGVATSPELSRGAAIDSIVVRRADGTPVAYAAGGLIAHAAASSTNPKNYQEA